MLFRSVIHSKKQDKELVTGHYDRGNEFFEWFLGEVMGYKLGREAVWPPATRGAHRDLHSFPTRCSFDLSSTPRSRTRSWSPGTTTAAMISSSRSWAR